MKLMKSSFAKAGAVLIVVLIVIVMGPRFYLRSPYNYIVAGLILLGYLGWFLFEKMRAKKNASALEGFLNQQADDQLLTARPDVKDEIAALKEKMELAIRTLKHSKLGKGRRGADALYILPWYMIIGPSACGKSTAIRNSGLSFPPIDPDSDSPGAIKGLGGTRNCDWWFTNEGIILDTAGRYTISIDSAEDREEWSAFLDLLKRFRKRNPINGLLVMVSVDELVQQTEDGLEAHAKNIRQRIDELIVKLEIIFPIYLVFTKCDLLSGFVEFFGDLSKREREQVWGYTVKFDPDRTSPVHEEFRHEVDKLFSTLKSRRLRKLYGDLRPGDEKKVYLFPMEFEAARRKLTSFVETLFQPNPFQQNPALRGMYFTSGTQEGTPIGQVMGDMAKEFNLQEDMAAILEPPKETKAYFIKDLFTDVIMPDQAASRPTAGSAKRNKLIRLALAVAIGLGAALLTLGVATSYFGNRGILANTLKSTQTLDEVQGDGRETMIADLEVLDRVRKHLETLDEWDQGGPPLRLRWGLYKGETVNRAARQAHLHRLTEILLRPTAQQFEHFLRETTLEDSVGANERFFDVGTAYMICTEPPDSGPSDIEALIEQTNYVWTAGEAVDIGWQEDFERLAEPQIRYWWKNRTDLGAKAIVLAKNRSVYDRVKREIADNWSVERYYNKLIREANGNLRNFTVDAAVPGTTLLDGRPLHGAYTAEGWEQQVSKLIDRSKEEIEQDPFLSKALSDIKVDIRRDLFTMYVANYRRAWHDFFDNLQISSSANIGEALDALGELSEDGSPIIALLKKVAENAKIDTNGERISEIYDEFYGINEFLGRTGVIDEVAGGSSENEDKFREYIGNASGKLEEGEAALEANEECGKSYRALARALVREQERAEKLIVRSRSTLSRKASELLGKPFDVARSAAYSNACNCLNEAWDTQVRRPFEEQLGTNYPFNAHGPEAPLSGIVDFFGGSGGGIGKFEEDEGRDAAQAGIGLSGAYNSALTVAKRIRAMIAGNALNVSFKLTARAPQFDNVQEATFSLGSNSKKYMMGGTRTYDFSWPSDGTDCSISLIPLSGRQVSPLRESGDWALFKIIDKARISGNVIKWTMGGSGDASSTAGYELGGSAVNFIQNGHFTAFRCPARVCGE